MSAQVVTLPVMYDPRKPMTRLERAWEWAQDARCRLMSKSPVVIERRSTMEHRERNAFELGREVSMYRHR